MPHLRIALLIETSREYGRGLLRGVIRYQQEHGPWSVFCKAHALDAPPSHEFKGWQGDGILLRTDNPLTAEAAIKTGLPIIDMRISLKQFALPIVGIDNHAVVKLAADHLIGQGHQRFAFYGTPASESFYMDMRATEFVNTIEQYGYSCETYQHPSGKHNWDAEQEHLTQWLKALPKPIGIMTCNDERGQQLIDASLRAGLAVPHEVGIIGVDNDHFLCNLSSPPLSSVDINLGNIGYTAADQLTRMIQGESPPPSPVLLQPRQVVIRQSSDLLAIADVHVKNAIEIIRGHACQEVSIEQLLERIPISQNALRARFKKLLGHSPKEEMTRVRIDQAKQLLRTTQLAVTDIAQLSGYAESKYFIDVFTRKTGSSPLSYRKKFTHGKTAQVQAL